LKALAKDKAAVEVLAPFVSDPRRPASSLDTAGVRAALAAGGFNELHTLVLLASPGDPPPKPWPVRDALIAQRALNEVARALRLGEDTPKDTAQWVPVTSAVLRYHEMLLERLPGNAQVWAERLGKMKVRPDTTLLDALKADDTAAGASARPEAEKALSKLEQALLLSPSERVGFVQRLPRPNANGILKSRSQDLMVGNIRPSKFDPWMDERPPDPSLRVTRRGAVPLPHGSIEIRSGNPNVNVDYEDPLVWATLEGPKIAFPAGAKPLLGRGGLEKYVVYAVTQ
jgi:hypothetical protein